MLGLELMPNGAAPKGRFSDEDAKKILEKVDQIIVSATAPIEDLVASRAMDVQSDQVNEFARYKDRWATLLESKAAINWLRRHNALQAETASFGHLGLVLWALRPDKIRFPFVNASPEYQFLVGELYATRREATYLMLNTPDIVAVLPSSIRVQELRALEAETRTLGMPALRSLGFHDGLRGIDGPIYRTVVRVSDRLTPQLVQLAQPAREQLEQLASKYRGNPRKP